MTVADSAERAQQRYDPRAVQEKWQTRWATMDLFQASDDPDDPRPRTYLLDMFPYPSGDLHMGHAEVFALHDVIARYWWQRGYEVLNPMGFDSFGLNAENAAIRDNAHPATFTTGRPLRDRQSLPSSPPGWPSAYCNPTAALGLGGAAGMPP